MKKTKAGIQITYFFLFATFMLGCAATEEYKYQHEQNKSQLTLYMNGPEKTSLDITFDLISVNIVSEEGSSREVTRELQHINSIDMQRRQILLGETMLPEGKYKKIQLIVNNAYVKSKGKTAALSLPDKMIELNIDTSVIRNQNTTLFLNWNADSSVHDSYMFKPAFTVKGKAQELSSLLIYVTNEGSDNVSVINRQSAEVAATIMVGKKPRGIAVSRGRRQLKVYVANSGSNSISVIDPSTNRIENEIPIRFGNEPEGIAVATTSSNKELIFVANYGSNNVSVIDATTFQEIEKIDVGRGPIAIAVDPPIEEILGTSDLSLEDISVLRNYRNKFINVYVANHNSNDISVIRIDTLTQKSAEVLTLNVEWRPIALYVDYRKGKVFIANYGSDRVSVLDIVKTVTGNTSEAISNIKNVGTSITGVISDPVFDRIYLLKEVQGEIMIIRPFAKVFDSLKTIMPPVTGIIATGGSPRSFILGPEGRKLYVVNKDSNSVSIIDRTTKNVEQVIPVGKSPYGITVFQD
jgi:YVTN family beta-propeller protein